DALDRAERALGRPVDARIPFSSAAVYGEQVWRVGDRDAPASLLLEYSRLGKLVGEGLPQPEPETGEELTARVFALQGYAIDSPEDPRVRVDFVAQKDELLGPTRMGIVGVAGTGRGQAGLVTEAKKQLKRGRLDSAVLVTESAPTKVLMNAAARESQVSVVGMPDLLDRLLDWRSYLHWLADETADAGWAEHLGRLHISGWPDAPPAREPADRWLIESWLTDETPLLVLVGPEDAGRSTLSRWLAHDLAQSALTRDSVTSGRVPLLLPLGSYRREVAVDSLLADLVADRRHFGRRPAPVDPVDALKLLHELGRMVIVVEEIDRLPDPDAAMREIAKLAGPHTKLLINRYVTSPNQVDRTGLPVHRIVTFDRS
ncbi:MAG: hypothetical protein KDA24_30270, partial [Deltaproteobacteria bacterium]|nr:hypothetical protein [Deltaproteobacteria bacterium]